MIYLIAIAVLIAVVVFAQKQDPAPTQRRKPSTNQPHGGKRYQQARDYIRNSGDAYAIEELDRIKDHPEAYSNTFVKNAHKNQTLKIALGLLAGYLTWELLHDDNRQEEYADALRNLDQDLEDSEMEELYNDLDDTEEFEDMMDD